MYWIDLLKLFCIFLEMRGKMLGGTPKGLLSQQYTKVVNHSKTSLG